MNWWPPVVRNSQAQYQRSLDKCYALGSAPLGGISTAIISINIFSHA